MQVRLRPRTGVGQVGAGNGWLRIMAVPSLAKRKARRRYSRLAR